MHSFYPVVRVFGVLLMGFSLTMLVPLALSWYWHDGAESAYNEAFALALSVGSRLVVVGAPPRR